MAYIHAYIHIYTCHTGPRAPTSGGPDDSHDREGISVVVRKDTRTATADRQVPSLAACMHVNLYNDVCMYVGMCV